MENRINDEGSQHRGSGPGVGVCLPPVSEKLFFPALDQLVVVDRFAFGLFVTGDLWESITLPGGSTKSVRGVSD